MVCTSLGSLLRPLFYFLCYIHFSTLILLQLLLLLLLLRLLRSNVKQLNNSCGKYYSRELRQRTWPFLQLIYSILSATSSLAASLLVVPFYNPSVRKCGDYFVSFAPRKMWATEIGMKLLVVGNV